MSEETAQSTPPSATLDRSRAAVVAAIGLAYGFFVYGVGRTNWDQVGFDLSKAGSDLVVLAIFLSMMLGPALLAGAAFHRMRMPAAKVNNIRALAVAVLLVVALGVPALYVYFVGPVASGVVLAGTMRRTSSRAHLLALGVLAAASVVGAALSEVWVLIDEARFREEIAQSGADHQIGRDRWWPNGHAGMQYAPDRGVWGTD